MVYKFLFLTLSATFSFYDLFSIPKVDELPQDMYPARGTITEMSQQVCQKFQADQQGTLEKLPQLIAPLFPQSQRISLLPEGTKTRFTLKVEASEPLFIQIITSENKQSFSLSVRRSTEEIESVSSISLATGCSLYQAFHTFYNSEKRPYLRIKTNAQGQTILKVKMEEPLKAYELKKEKKPSLSIGIIDSGIDYNHESLIEKTRPFIGIDLKTPGRPPYDYTNSIQNELMGRTFYHGTAVAQLASKDLPVQIVPVRIENQSKSAGDAVEYLASKKVRIINLSQGSWKKEDWESFRSAVLRHPEILFIVAAGNESTNIDEEPSYPAAFNLDNMIVVASVNKAGDLSSFSNYGPERVHIATEGEDILAAQAGGGYRELSGTSFAAPKVAHFAAQLLLKSTQMSTQNLKQKIINATKETSATKGKIKYGVLQ